MNIQRLKEEEERFFQAYPGGFQDPKMAAILKKHRIERLVKIAQEGLVEETFADPKTALGMIEKIITASSLVSVFEKTAFRNHVREITEDEKTWLVLGFKELLHGDQGAGFRMIVQHLTPYKMAKWPIITAPLYYYNPWEELIIKPTSVKNVINYFQIEDVHYQSKPEYDFYVKYRETFKRLKAQVRPELQIENGAFSGFLMFAMRLYS